MSEALGEYKEGHLKGAILIPLYELDDSIENNIKDKQTIIIAYCQVGKRSKKAINILRKHSYRNIFHLKGGLDGNDITFL